MGYSLRWIMTWLRLQVEYKNERNFLLRTIVMCACKHVFILSSAWQVSDVHEC